ncbi:MAG: GGDEF domain-containing protein [Lachnospiraceae bacterium]|nr:GGDEF domain-containing protein [Lachnospiraceae bacterium]
MPMKKDMVKKYIIGVSVFFIFCLLLQLLIFGTNNLLKRSNHAKVTDYIDNDITYAQENMDAELATMTHWIENEPLYDEDIGHLYERASEIYRFRNDEINYYRYLGYALFYLERADELTVRLNIYLNLASFYINNYSFELAEQMMSQVTNLTPLSAILSPQEKSYAYRLQAQLDCNKGKYSEALTNMERSDKALEGYEDMPYAPAYLAMNDAVRAYIYTYTNEYDKTKAILDEYRDSELFQQTAFVDVLQQDFMLPYYKANCFIAVQELSHEDSRVVVDQFLEFCETNHFKQHELHTLLRLIEQAPSGDAIVDAQVYDLIDDLYSELFTDLSVNYAVGTMAQMEDARYQIEAQVSANEHQLHRFCFGFSAFAVIMALIGLSFLLILSGRVDGLTKVNNRKAFDADLAKIKKQNTDYTIIMIDIDNFKHVNDEYGHPNGDVVLQTLGQILNQLQNSTTHCYRYGGEEFVVMLTQEEKNIASAMAEAIRTTFKNIGWTFDPHLTITLSLGIASGKGEDEVVAQADDLLYKAKKSGKDQYMI